MRSVDGASLRHCVGECHSPTPQEPCTDAPRQQQTYQRRVEQRTDHRGFHLPVVVNDSTDGADVNGAVQYAPTAAAEAANPAGGRCNRQRNEQSEREKAHGDERALVNVFPDFVSIEKLVEPKISGEMQAGVEKGEEAEHSAKTD